MAMTANRVLALCEKAAHFMEEDVTLMDAGHLKVEMFGADVTAETLERVKERLSLLHEIIEGCGCHCV